MAAIATKESIGAMPGVLSGPLHAPGPLSFRVLPPDDPLHRNQPFYVPAVPPLFPYQWSMATPYVPYGGFHGLGYGTMPLLLTPCLEVPGYMIPNAQLPILDYRHITSHVAPTFGHQTHSSHFQNGVPIGRVMVSSEVQTEPICHNVDSYGHAARSQNCSESGRGTGCGSPVSTSPCSPDNKSGPCPEGSFVLTQNCNATNAIDAVPKSEILQAERIQIKCSKMPSGLKIFQNMELSGHSETDLLQCSLPSLRTSEDVVLCSYQSLALRKDKQKVEAGMLRYSSKHGLPACTEVTVVRTPSCRPFKTCTETSSSVITQSIAAKKKCEMPFHAKIKVGNSSSVQFKILRLPFDIQNHNQPCQIEASIWSEESLIPYVPSSELMTENGLLTPQKHLNPLIEPSDSISKRNCVPVGNYLQTDTSTKYCDLPRQLEASIWSVESLMPYVPSNEWMVENGFLTPQKPLSPSIKSIGVLSELNQSSANGILVGKNLQSGASTKYHDLPCQLEASIWSVESLMPCVPSNEWMVENGFLTPQKPLSPKIKTSVLSELNQSSTNGIPVGENLQTVVSTEREDSLGYLKAHSPYRPSTSWLADLGNVYYYSKLRQQPNVPERQLPKMSLAISLDSSPLRNGKETRNQRPAIGISDQEHGSFHTCKCKVKSNPRLGGDSMTCDWVSHSTLEKKIPFCQSCRSDMKGKDHGKLYFSDGLGCKGEEISLKTFEKRATLINDTQKTILGSSLAKCCATYPKIRDRTGLCENCLCLTASHAQDKCADLEWRICGKGGEDCIINPNKRLLQRLEKDNGVLQKGRMLASKAERIQNLPYPQEFTQQNMPWRE